MIKYLIAPAAFGIFQFLIFTGAAWYFLKSFNDYDFPGNRTIARLLVVIIYATGVYGIANWIYWNL
jgi:hypothetical protein